MHQRRLHSQATMAHVVLFCPAGSRQCYMISYTLLHSPVKSIHTLTPAPLSGYQCQKAPDPILHNCIRTTIPKSTPCLAPRPATAPPDSWHNTPQSATAFPSLVSSSLSPTSFSSVHICPFHRPSSLPIRLASFPARCC